MLGIGLSTKSCQFSSFKFLLQLYTSKQLKDSLERQITVIHRVHADGTNMDKLDALVRGFRDTYRARVETAVDYMYADYALEAARLRQYLSHLQKSEELTGTEELHKELFESWTVLVTKHDILKTVLPDDPISTDD